MVKNIYKGGWMLISERFEVDLPLALAGQKIKG